MATKYKAYNDSLAGLQNRYKKSFIENYAHLIQDREIWTPVKDKNDEFHTKAFKILENSFDDFQKPFQKIAIELGKANYASSRVAAERRIRKAFQSFDVMGVKMPKSIIDDNVLNYKVIAGVLKKVVFEDASMEWVASMGARGMADLSRKAVFVAAEADPVKDKVAYVNTSAGACEFCGWLARNIVDFGHDFKKLHWHENCNCSVIFDFEDAR